jgi:hypothetical protein
MRKLTAFQVGRTTLSPDFRAGSSVITTFRDLIPGWRLFVFNGTTARRPPVRVSGGPRVRAPAPFSASQVIFLGSGNRRGSPAPVVAAQGRLRAKRRAVWAARAVARAKSPAGLLAGPGRSPGSPPAGTGPTRKRDAFAGAAAARIR